SIVVWVVLVVLLLGAADRLLLAMESRGWINYRRTGLSRGAALYHTFEIQSIFDPSIQPVIEIAYQEQKEQDEAGDPPARDSDEGPGSGMSPSVATEPGGAQPDARMPPGGGAASC